jgi:dihydroneopterin aldolase
MCLIHCRSPARPNQTLEALGEAVAIGLLRQFPAIETNSVGVSKFSPPIPHTLSKVGIAVRLARAELDDKAGRIAEPAYAGAS